ncbi:MAG: glycosyl hydrolase-related protein [Flavobacteriaceae bacterium]|nr:glycosyl hydrolase-related protein [Flavobacteriaceae bacterium]
MLLVVTSNLYSQTSDTRKTLILQYIQPYEYKIEHNILLAKAFLPKNKRNNYDSVVFEDGRKSKIEQNSSKAWAWFPVIGKPQIMEIIFSKGNNKKQLFTPLVTSDWDYFKEGTFHIISSSHQDVAWMDTPEACRHDRIYEIIGPAMDIMKKDTAYYFTMEQALNLKEFVEEIPERKNEVIERYKEGRFTYGATYNQPYEGMLMGEQLIRQMYFGKLWIEKNFEGVIENTAFNTDIPGRTLQLSQILAKSGTEHHFVSRLKEGFYDWHSPDGSSVLTYSPGNYGWAVLFYKLFESDAIESLRKIQDRVKMWSDYYRKHNLPPHFAIVISNDASGPVDYGHIVKEWNKIISETGAKIPKLRHSTVSGFLSKINQPSAKFEEVHGSRPNIWAYIHGPGHHKAITASRKAGRFLPSAEVFSTIDALLENSFEEYPEEALQKAFEASIYPDHGWGGKNGHITDSIFRVKLEFANLEANRLLDRSLHSISEKIRTSNENAVVVYNDLSWKRNGLVSVNIQEAASYHILDENGILVPSQPSSHDVDLLQFYANDIPAIGFKTFYLKKGKRKHKSTRTVFPNALTNNYYTIHFGEGGIDFLLDRRLNKEVLKTTRFKGGDILTLGYDGNGAGEFTQFTKPNMDGYDKTSNHVANWVLVEDGAIFSEFENKAKFNHCEVVQRIRVHHQEKKIDFFVDLLNWNGTRNREFRFALPLNMQDSKIKYEVPLAIEEVGQSEMKEAPGGWGWEGTYDQKPVAIHPREVLNYIYSENEEFAMTMALDVAVADHIDPTREAVDYPVLQGILLASHKSCHGEGNWYHQTGDHHYHFSMTSHKPDDRTSYQFGVASNHPLRTVLKLEKDPNAKLQGTMSFFETSDPMVRISTIKKSEEGENVILRLVEMEGKDKRATIKLSIPFQQLFKTNLIEKEEGSVIGSGKEFDVDLGHNSIETYKLVFNK